MFSKSIVDLVPGTCRWLWITMATGDADIGDVFCIHVGTCRRMERQRCVVVVCGATFCLTGAVIGPCKLC